MTPKVDEVDYNMLSQIYENTKNNSKMLSSILSSLPNSPGRLCASLRNQNTYGHVTKAIFDLLYNTSKKKGQEPRASTSIKHRPSLLPYETLSVGTLMGKKKKVLQLMTIINNQFQAPISRYFCSCCSPSAPQL